MIQPKTHRVLHIIGSFEIGGAEKLLLDFADHFHNKRYSLVLAYLKGNGSLLQNRSVRWKVVDVSNGGAFTFRSIPRLIRLVRTEGIDMLHVHDPQSGLIGRIVAMICGIKIVLATRHIPELVGNYPFIYWLENRALRRYIRVIVNSRAVQRFLLQRKYLEENHSVIAYNGIDMDVFTPNAPKEQRYPLTVGTVARLKHYKGVDVLLKAFSTVLRSMPDVRLRIVGDGDERKQLEVLSARLGIGNNVEFLGSIDTGQGIASFLGELDVFVLPSRIEGFGLSIVEAMAMHLPVIGSRIDGIMEIVEDGVNGILFESENSSQLSEKLLILLGSRTTREEIAEAGSESVRRKFTIDAYVDSVTAVYNTVTEETMNYVH